MKIVLVGAGPRNLSLLERLISNAYEVDQSITVTMYDPFPIGGRVWNPDQDPTFLMNTVTQQLTLFTDASINHSTAQSIEGPNFYEWATKYGREYIIAQNLKNTDTFLDELAQISPNRFSSRALFGVYAHWYFERVTATLPSNLEIDYQRLAVTDVERTDDDFIVSLANEEQVRADQVILTLGNTDHALNLEEQTFADAAHANSSLNYLAPTHPNEAKLEQIPAKDDVILRGLGLSFFDYIAKLTLGRGGHFVRDTVGELSYQPSGLEPHIIAGSRSGLPMHARGVNQKVHAESYQPVFFTEEDLDKAAQANHGHATFDSFLELVRKELEYKHYQNTINDLAVTWPFNVNHFMNALRDSENLNLTAKAFGLADQYIIDWDSLLNPVAKMTKDVNYDLFMLDYLAWDIADASKGNIEAPYAGAFDLLRDVRGVIRYNITAGYLSGDEYAKFLATFNPWNSLLSVGPPLLRVEQMRALIKAKVLTIAGPGLAVTATDDTFTAHDNRDGVWSAKSLVEARLSTPDLNTSTNPPIMKLRERGILAPGHFTSPQGPDLIVKGAQMDRETKQVVDINDQIIPGLYIWGVPTEGWSWFTTFASRPGVHDKNLQDAEDIAHNIFKK